MAVYRGTPRSDNLRGRATDDQLFGFGADDVLNGAHGADLLDGGSGRDTATYQSSKRAVQVDLAAGTGRGGEAQGDTLRSIERVVGSRNDDRLSGGTLSDTLEGASGQRFPGRP